MSLPAMEPPKASSPSASLWHHLVNVIKSFIGSNYLSIPFAFAAAGLALGPIAVFAIAAISGYGCLLLVKIRRRMQLEGHNADTYGEVAQKTLGPLGYTLVEGFLVFTQFGYCVGYTIYISTAIVQLIGTSVSQQVVTCVLAPFFFALCCVPDLKYLIPFTLVSNLALLLGYVTILVVDSGNVHRSGFQTRWETRPSKLPLAFGNLVASFEGIGTILPVEGSMATDGVREGYPLLLTITLVLTSVLFSAFGVMGYGSFGDELCSVILANLGDGAAATVVRVSLVVGLFFTYGFQMFPVLEVLDLKAFRHPPADACASYGSIPCDATFHQTPDAAERLSDGRPTIPVLLPSAGSQVVHKEEVPMTEMGGGEDGRLAVSSPSRSSGSSRGSVREYSVTCLPLSRRLDHTRHWLGHTQRGRTVRFLLHRVGVVALSTFIAALIPEFELVISFIGSLGASFLAFIIPGLLALRTPGMVRNHKDAIGYVLLMVVGLVGGGIGSSYSLKSLIRGESQC